MQPIFITGIGTDVGKTLVAAIVTEALQAIYWKPVQAGYAEGTDSEWVAERISHPHGRIWPETYKLALPASPHIAARQEGLEISLDKIVLSLTEGQAQNRPVVIEGAGGLLVPLNEKEFVLDLVKKLDATVILVSRNYLGSINHSLLTAALCQSHGLKVAGWIFNDQYGHYEAEIAQWSGFPSIASIPFYKDPDTEFVRAEGGEMRASLLAALR
jgi:dethiobiotin synthetase